MRGVPLAKVAPSGSGTTNGVFLTGRGPCVAVDFVTAGTQVDPLSTLTATIGGQQVVQNAMPNQFAFDAFPGTYKRVLGLFGENQNFQIFLTNGGPAQLNTYMVEYYQNEFAPEKVARLLADSTLQTKRVTFASITGVGTQNTFTSIVPLNRGKIFAIQPFVTLGYLDDPQDLEDGTVTIDVNGVEIIQAVPALHIANRSTRNNFFPIDIEPGATINCNLNAIGAGDDLRGGFILYFAPDNAQC